MISQTAQTEMMRLFLTPDDNPGTDIPTNLTMREAQEIYSEIVEIFENHNLTIADGHRICLSIAMAISAEMKDVF